MAKGHVELPGAFSEPVSQSAISTEPGQPDNKGLAELGVTSLDGMRTTATDPPVSEAQRGAMHAAAAGKGRLGIPRRVAKEFVSADEGGKLPKKAKRRGRSK